MPFYLTAMAVNSEQLTSVLSGSAGEYFVAGELCRRGYLASILLNNARGIDIQCSNREATKTIGIQVKTSKGRQTEWVLNKKIEGYYADNLFYIFVCLNSNQDPPDYFIVPSKTVAEFAKTYHQEWLTTPGRKGQMHKDNPMRKFRDEKKIYLNRWELLGL